MPYGDLSRPKENTMKFRMILICTLLLLAASPSFALPVCGHCNEWNTCESASGDVERCRYDTQGNCIITTERCSPAFQGTVLTDWKVVSIEISRPALESVTVTAPTAVAEVPTQAPRTTDLK
jgi:hypothetical protein